MSSHYITNKRNLYTETAEFFGCPVYIENEKRTAGEVAVSEPPPGDHDFLGLVIYNSEAGGGLIWNGREYVESGDPGKIKVWQISSTVVFHLKYKRIYKGA
jgi:hypothetical protein